MTCQKCMWLQSEHMSVYSLFIGIKHHNDCSLSCSLSDIYMYQWRETKSGDLSMSRFMKPQNKHIARSINVINYLYKSTVLCDHSECSGAQINNAPLHGDCLQCSKSI